jgi:UDP-glucose 4-epimerase
MTVLVTGATGFIGKRLMLPGYRALVRQQTGLWFDEVVGDITDIDSLRLACHGVSTIYHLAGHASTDNSDLKNLNWRINLEGTKNLLKVAVEAGVKKFIFISSVKAMSESQKCCLNEESLAMPSTRYGRSKLAAEEAVLQAGLKYPMHVVNLRLAAVYGKGGKGNIARMIKGIKGGWFPPLPELGNKRSTIHVSDVISAIYAVSSDPRASGKTYIVSNHTTYSSCEIYEEIMSILGKKIRFRMPLSVLKQIGFMGDLVGIITKKRLPVNSDIISRFQMSSEYSSRLIEEELGWSAKISLREGLLEALS